MSRDIVLRHDKLERSQLSILRFEFSVASGVASLISGAPGAPLIFGETATPFTIALVNALLEFDSTGAALSTTSTSELATTTMFGSTAMGTDAFGIVVACGGGVKKAHFIRAIEYSNSSSAIKGEYKGANSSEPGNSLASALWTTPAGNVAARLVINGHDSISAGFLSVEIGVVLK
jgi:hypothetical protein